MTRLIFPGSQLICWIFILLVVPVLMGKRGRTHSDRRENNGPGGYGRQESAAGRRDRRYLPEKSFRRFSLDRPDGSDWSQTPSLPTTAAATAPTADGTPSLASPHLNAVTAESDAAASATSTLSVASTSLTPPTQTASSPGYVTQEALSVRDTSFSVLPKVQQLLADRGTDYAEVFGSELLGAAGNVLMMTQLLNGTISEQAFDGESYIESVVRRKGRPFLFTGSHKSRTKKNCYLIRADDKMPAETRKKIQSVLEALGGTVKARYDTRGLSGFSVCFADKELPLALLKSITGLVRVERDQYSTFQYVQEAAPWQLVRLNDEASKLTSEGPYAFNATGKGVNVYTIDSGVMPDHAEFSGRAKIGYSIFPNFPNDCAGHGTQVASVIAGINVGVAKQANIIAVQVLDCDGQGENSAVLSALNWVIANHQKPAVINMSVGGPKSPSVDEAVETAVARGISVVVAAGNSQIDACMLSPSGIETAMVVGAATMDHKRASFSNFGSCVSVFAPGQHIVTAALPSQATKNGFTFVSGTSLSAPLVTGLYALLLEANPNSTPAQLKAAIVQRSLSGKMDKSTLFGSPDLLAQTTPDLPNTPNVDLVFLPRGILPIFGSSAAGVSTLEIVMIAVGAVLVPIFFLLILVVIFKRYRRKREERRLAKLAMSLH